MTSTVTSHAAGLSRTVIVSRSRISPSRWHSQTKSKAREEPNTATVIQACLLTTRSKMFRQHLKCSLTAPRRAGTSSSSGFFLFLFTQPAVWGCVYTYTDSKVSGYPGRRYPGKCEAFTRIQISGTVVRHACAMRYQHDLRPSFEGHSCLAARYLSGFSVIHESWRTFLPCFWACRMCKSTPSKETFLWEADEMSSCFRILQSSITRPKRSFLQWFGSPSEFSKIADTGIFLSKNYFWRDWGREWK